MPASASINGQRWQLDDSFGSGGIVSTVFPGQDFAWGYAGALQPDGRILVAGLASDFDNDVTASARYRQDGSLDTSYGDGGRVVLGPHALFRATAVTTQRVGGRDKIVIAASTTYRAPYRYRCSVIRLNADGSLDTKQDGDPGISFGYDGVKVVEFPGNSGFCGGLTIDRDNKVVVTVEADSNDGDVGVVRLLPRNGAYDMTFGDAGKATIAAGGYQVPGPVAVQSGRGASGVVVGGLVSRAHGYDWALWRLKPDGTLDRSFGHDGRTLTPMYDANVPQSFESVRALAVRGDGSIVASGDYRSWPAGADGPQDTAAVAAYTADGTLDRSFGDHGRVHVPYDARGNTSAADVTIDADGRILFGGSLAMPTSGAFIVGGWTSDGTPDRRFGPEGTLEFRGGGGPYDGAASIDLDSRGRIVLSGIYGLDLDDRFAVARLSLG